MKLEHIKAFTTVVEQQSFHKAAEVMHLGVSAVSKRVKQLLEESDVKLMESNTRGFTLTEAGELFYQQCCEVMSSVNQAEATLMALVAKPEGNLNIHATEFLGKTMLLPYLQRFMQTYPDIHITLHLNDQIADFDREEVDIFWGVAVDGPDYTKRKKLLDSKQVLVASPDYVRQQAVAKTPQDLMAWNYIGHANRLDAWEDIHFSRHATLRLPAKLKVNNTLDMLTLAKQGVGLVNLFEFEVESALKDGELVRVLPALSQEKKSIYCYYRNTKITAPKIRCFIDDMLEHGQVLNQKLK